MPAPPITIDRRSPIPLYFQISRRLEAAVDRGELSPGERLPNKIELAESLAISRPTFKRTLDELVEKGILVGKQSVGTHVTNAQVRRVALTSLFEDLNAPGTAPRTKVLHLDTACIDRYGARALRLPADQPIVYCERLRFADGEPLAIMHNRRVQPRPDCSASRRTHR